MPSIPRDVASRATAGTPVYKDDERCYIHLAETHVAGEAARYYIARSEPNTDPSIPLLWITRKLKTTGHASYATPEKGAVVEKLNRLAEARGWKLVRP